MSTDADALADEGDRILKDRARAKLAAILGRVGDESTVVNEDLLSRVTELVDKKLQSRTQRHSDVEIDEIVDGAFDEITRDPQQGLSMILRELHRKRKP